MNHTAPPLHRMWRGGFLRCRPTCKGRKSPLGLAAVGIGAGILLALILPGWFWWLAAALLLIAGGALLLRR